MNAKLHNQKVSLPLHIAKIPPAVSELGCYPNQNDANRYFMPKQRELHLTIVDQ